MSKICPITGRRKQFGNRVSHANNKTRRCWEPNLQIKRIWDPELGRFVRLRISARGLRTIQKMGLNAALRKRKPAKKG